MLKLHFGDLEGVRYSGDGWFDNQLDSSVILKDFSKKVIKGVDDCDVVSENLVISDVLGPIPPSRLSGGTKTLMCLMYTDWLFSITAMGENCYKYLKEIADQKDVTLCCDSIVTLFKFADFGKIQILNDNSFVETDKELVFKGVDFI